MAEATHLQPVPDNYSTEQERYSGIWKAMSHVFGEPVTATERSYRGKAVTELHDAGATGTDVTQRAAALVKQWGHPKYLTIGSLLKHWSRPESLIGTLSGDDVETMRRQERRKAIEDQVAAALDR